MNIIKQNADYLHNLYFLDIFNKLESIFLNENLDLNYSFYEILNNIKNNFLLKNINYEHNFINDDKNIKISCHFFVIEYLTFISKTNNQNNDENYFKCCKKMIKFLDEEVGRIFLNKENRESFSL